MIVHCFKKIHVNPDVYVSLFERKGNRLRFDYWIKYVCVFCSKYRSRRQSSVRYTLSRYHLIMVSKIIPWYKNLKYCFSHSGQYTALVVSQDLMEISVDIEPLNRKIAESIKVKIRNGYPNLLLQELGILSILESLVKLPVFNKPVILSKGLVSLHTIKIFDLGKMVYQIEIDNVIVHSKIFVCTGIRICVTITADKPDLFL